MDLDRRRSASEEHEPPLPSVSVVIPTRNGRERLEGCLEALRGARQVADIVVVVDGPDPDTERLLRRRHGIDPSVVPVVVSHRGPAGARAVGVELARGDVVLFLEDDVVAGPGLVEGHAHRHARRTDILVAGYTPVRGTPVGRPGMFAARLYAEEYERMCTTFERDPSQILLNLWGCFSLRRSDCERIGIASPVFPLTYHEDRDFGIRCHKAGLVGVFDRSLLAEHRYTTDAAGFAADSREQGAGRVLVHRLHEDVIGPLDASAFSADLPPLVGAAVRLTAGRRSYAVASVLLARAVKAAGAMRLIDIETLLARLLRRVEQQHGALSLDDGGPPAVRRVRPRPAPTRE